MIPNQNRIKKQSNPTLQERYAISQPTITASIPTKIMEGDEEKTGLQQACKDVHVEPDLAKDKEAKR